MHAELKDLLLSKFATLLISVILGYLLFTVTRAEDTPTPHSQDFININEQKESVNSTERKVQLG